MENKEKFATFFGEASKGRKLGAIFAWIAAVALIAALFVPAFGIDYANKPAEGETPQPISSEVHDSLENSTDAKALVDELQESSVSLVGYLTSVRGQLNKLNNPAEEPSSILGIVLLVVYAVLAIATVVTALFTMNVLSLVATAAAVVEVLLLYFMGFSSKVAKMLVDFGATSGKAAPSIVMIIVLAAAVVLQIIGVILTYVIHSDDEEEEPFWDDDNEDRNAETGLFDGSNVTTTSVQAAASIVQMNTGKTFPVPEGAEIVIGKGSQANIIVSNPIISRAHAKISFRGGVCTIQDLGSKNGTFVGDQKLPNGGSAIVPNGAYITLGNEIFQFNF